MFINYFALHVYSVIRNLQSVIRSVVPHFTVCSGCVLLNSNEYLYTNLERCSFNNFAAYVVPNLGLCSGCYSSNLQWIYHQ